MLTFLSKSFSFVFLYSLIRLIIGIYVASFILPSDYAIILLPFLLYGFLDVYIEGGFIASTIKHGLNQDEERYIKKAQLKSLFIFAPLFFIALLIYDFYHQDKFLPLLVITNYCLISLLKIYTYTKEGLFVARGYYIAVESLSFFMSLLTYALIFYLIFNTDIEGYYLLCLWHSVFVFLYALSLNILSRFYVADFDKETSFATIKDYAKTNRNVALLFNLNNRVDEISASNILGANNLGIFAKFKELAINFGELTSKVINKPWFFVACNSKKEYVRKIYFLFLLLFFFIFLLGYPVLIYLINFIITMMGENWIVLMDYGSYILVFLFSYFLCEYTKATLLACGGENFVFSLEKGFFIVRLFLYSFLPFASYFGLFKIDAFSFVIIELVLRVIFFILENFKLLLILRPKIQEAQ
tara:strand:+ start:25303 stop:26541 length:1239 start_codon:yes stop_codon:yes gene_type:complete